MKKLLQKDILSFAFVASIIVFGTSQVFLFAFDLSSRGKIVFIIFSIASFFTSLSLILQILEKRKTEK